jgi:hypothetical protein
MHYERYHEILKRKLMKQTVRASDPQVHKFMWGGRLHDALLWEFYPFPPALHCPLYLTLASQIPPRNKLFIINSKMFYTLSIKVSFLYLTDACPASQWGTSAILATQKAERGRIAMWGQPRQKSFITKVYQ